MHYLFKVSFNRFREVVKKGGNTIDKNIIGAPKM